MKREKISKSDKARATEDKVLVMPYHMVWEIVYKYHNAESSTPRAERKRAKRVPEGVKMWRHRENADKAIRQITKEAADVPNFRSILSDLYYAPRDLNCQPRA